MYDNNTFHHTTYFVLYSLSGFCNILSLYCRQLVVKIVDLNFCKITNCGTTPNSTSNKKRKDNLEKTNVFFVKNKVNRNHCRKLVLHSALWPTASVTSDASAGQ
ncbi:hypothetical protein XENORESO_015707 [Xenotaenia resolanae]|uniref:Uncharacterized protein n=1 Tax=Xenotaenia resolanae TaxID=208358 RepID=A0ABV0WRY9_9TELE